MCFFRVSIDPATIDRIGDKLSTVLDRFALQLGNREQLDRIELAITKLKSEETEMAATLDDLVLEVQEVKTVNASAITLINGIAAQLKAAQGDPTKIAAIIADLKGSATDLAAAVTANTTTPATDA